MKKIIQDKQLLIRRIFLMCYDVLAVFAASIVALLIRFDLNIKSVPFQYMDEVWRALPFMIIVTLIIFWMLRLYSSLWSYAGALEIMSVSFTACILDTVAVTVLYCFGTGGIYTGATKLLHSVWLVSVCSVMGCKYFLRVGMRVLSQYAQSRCVQTKCTCNRCGRCRKQDHRKKLYNSRYVRL